MADLNILADFAQLSRNPTPEVLTSISPEALDLIYKRKVHSIEGIPQPLIDFIDSLDNNGRWRRIYDTILFYKDLRSNHTQEDQQILLRDILLYALVNDDPLPLAIAQLLRIRIPYGDMREQLAKGFKDGAYNVLEYVATLPQVRFTAVLARYAAKSNNLEFFQRVIAHISEPIDMAELRDIAQQYGAIDIVMYIDSLSE